MVLWWKKKKPEAQSPPVPGSSSSPTKSPGAGGGVAADPPTAPEGEVADRSGWLGRLAAGMRRTRESFSGRLKTLFTDSATKSDDFFEEMEAILLAADCGVEVTQQIIGKVREAARVKPDLSGTEGLALIRADLSTRLSANPPPMNLNQDPFSVILIVGVNGVGKTTTIAKLAGVFKAYGKRLMLVAGDTFRAGAIEQLTIWGERLGIEVHKGSAGADPSSVIYDGLCAARARKVDLVLVDTAGRLQTQQNLMEEIRKVKRVIQKVVPDAPHETWLILDATTGQNALSQAALFDQALKLTGLVLTKLDGTAKGGIVLTVSQKLGVPIRFLGVGEGMDDLDAFKAAEFIDALFPQDGV